MRQVVAALVMCGVAGAVSADGPRPFSAYAGGARIAEGEIAASRAGDAYSISVWAQEAGLASIFVDVDYRATVNGLVGDGVELQPALFEVDIEWDGEGQLLDIEFGETGPVSVVYTPDPDWLDEPLPEIADQGGTVDPLTVFGQFVLPGEPEVMCGRDFEVFTGSRRLSLALGDPVYVSDVLVECSIDYTRFRMEDGEMVQQDYVFTVELRLREDGLFEALRLVGRTRFGALVIAAND
jgi:hypothetical protein